MSDDIRRSGISNPSSELRGVEASAREIGQIIGAGLPPGWGFGLMIFRFGESVGKESTWVSNAQRADMVKFLREFADKLELDKAGGPVAPFSQ